MKLLFCCEKIDELSSLLDVAKSNNLVVDKILVNQEEFDKLFDALDESDKLFSAASKQGCFLRFRKIPILMIEGDLR
jgi:hypothetical protein